MFGNRYFGKRYCGNRYFGQAVGDGSASPTSRIGMMVTMHRWMGR